MFKKLISTSMTIAFIGLSLFNSAIAGSNFTITPTTGTILPTTLHSGNTAQACYTITNNLSLNQVPLPPNPLQGYSVVLPNTTTLTLNTSGSSCPITDSLPSCSNPITLYAGDSCIQQLDISGPVTNYYFSIAKTNSATASTIYVLNVTNASTPSAQLISIGITPTSEIGIPSTTQQYTATGFYTNDTTANITNTVTWQSSDPSVVSINSNGLATALTTGTANITAHSQGLTSNSSVFTVSETLPTLQSISLIPVTSSITGLNSTQQFYATGHYSNGATADLATIATWNSSQTNIATINTAGLAEANNAAGQSVITATYDSVTSTSSTLTVSLPSAYIANKTSNIISICPLNNLGELTTCTASTALPSATGALDIVLNNAGNIAYVAANGGSGVFVLVCTIAANKDVSSCSPFSDVTFDFGNGAGLYINAPNTLLYVTNYDGNSVSICPINTDGSLSACQSSHGDGTFDGPNGRVTVTNNPNFSFMNNYSVKSASECQFDVGGLFTGCSLQTAGGTIPYHTVGLAVNVPQTHLYFTDSDTSQVTICPSSLSGCTTVSDSTFAINIISENLFISQNNSAYIPNGDNNTISICAIMEPGGLLAPCLPFSDATLSTPMSVYIAFQ